jgi:hypothetical protein
MNRFFTLRVLAFVVGMMMSGMVAWAGDGTKAAPYTVAELNAQKEALAASGETVWVKADLKGLGEDGTKTDNVTGEDNVKQMAGLFGDATGDFVAYSWQILGELALSDLTNTKDLLIALTYGTEGHPYGNSTSPQYASKYEPTEAHFSLGEVHGALKLDIKNGYRGYHIASCYQVPKEMVAVRVASNYTAAKGSTISYGYYDGAEEGKNYIVNKNMAMVLMAYDGIYDVVLSAGYYEQINSNSLSGGEKAGVNTIPMKNNALRYHYRFIANGEKVGFERNCEESTDVNLASKDEVYLTVNGAENHFFGNWPWETADKKWISWAGDRISDYHTQAAQATEATFDFTTAALRGYLGENLTDAKGYIYNETYAVENVSLNITGGSAQSRISVSTHGNCLSMYKEYSTLTFRAPEGYAVTKVAFSIVFGDLNFTPSTGTLAGLVWTGNAEGVRFLNNASAFLANAVVTLAAKDGATVALEPLPYVDCANIAAFNALDAGSYAKLTLTNAEVIGKSADGNSTVWLQDATGGCWIQYTSLNDRLQEGTRVNGTVYTVKRLNAGNSLMKETEDMTQSELQSEPISAYTVTEGTLAEVDVAANLNKVVKITGATFTATEATKGKLKQGDATIDVSNGSATANQQMHKISKDWTAGETMENITVVAILVGSGAEKRQLLPISMEEETAGIANMHTHDAAPVVVYNLQGIRQNKAQSGINIVNGKKIFEVRGATYEVRE